MCPTINYPPIDTYLEKLVACACHLVPVCVVYRGELQLGKLYVKLIRSSASTVNDQHMPRCTTFLSRKWRVTYISQANRVLTVSRILRTSVNIPVLPAHTVCALSD